MINTPYIKPSAYMIRAPFPYMGDLDIAHMSPIRNRVRISRRVALHLPSQSLSATWLVDGCRHLGAQPRTTKQAAKQGATCGLIQYPMFCIPNFMVKGSYKPKIWEQKTGYGISLQVPGPPKNLQEWPTNPISMCKRPLLCWVPWRSRHLEPCGTYSNYTYHSCRKMLGVEAASRLTGCRFKLQVGA